MMMYSRLTSLALLAMLILAGTAGAQNGTDEKLARQYLQDREFEKAMVLYEKLYDARGGDIYYHDYLICFLELQKLDDAEKLVRKQLKKNPSETTIHIDLGWILLKSGQTEKGNEQYEKALKILRADEFEIHQTADAFREKEEIDFAIKTYERGRKLLPGQAFHFELADLYAYKKDVPKVFNEYIEALSENEMLLQNVQNAIQTMLADDSNGKKNDYLKQLLIQKIQNNPETAYLNELLIWLFIQAKDFDSAFEHSRAADKRLKEEGQRLMNLAALCRSNQAYETAIASLKYVLSKGTDNPYYLSARMDLVEVMNLKITENRAVSQKELLELRSLYQSTLQDLGRNRQTTKLIRGWAKLETFYLNNPDTAIVLLENSLEFGLANKEAAEIKLELGDALLFVGEVWDASLLYSQAEKMFKNDAMGQEAKLRNARLSYYKGEFEWAAAQLNVLKSATSHFIANDALYLALVITDNISDEDSTGGALKLFSNADLLRYQNKDTEALRTLDSIDLVYPVNNLKDDVLYVKYQLAAKAGNFTEAATWLENLYQNFPDEVLADDALFRLAELYKKQLNDKEKARELYQEFLLRYPGSLFVVEARKNYRELRGDKLN